MKFYCHLCDLTFETIEGLARHQYQLHGGKIWPDTDGWLNGRLRAIRSEKYSYLRHDRSRLDS